jgi:outer membrane protein assembly factor BamB
MDHISKIFIAFICIFSSFQADGQVPTIKWWYDTHDSSFGQSAAEDIDGDGKLEVVFGCYRNDSSVYALNAEDGSLLWKYNASPIGGHGCNDVAPLIYDTNQDGQLEVIVPGSCNPKTFCFNGATGAVIWETETRGSDSPPTIADIDQDGEFEILHGEFGGYVICLNAESGTEEWEILVDDNSWVQTAPTLVDLDGDGQLDFVVATWNFAFQDSVYAYNGADQSLMWSFPILDHVYHGTAVSDFDSDGKPELLIGSYNDTLYCLNGEDGTLDWKFGGVGYVGSPAAIGDLDNDGVCDIVVTNGYKVTVLENDGSFKWDYILPGYSNAFRGVALADVNNDSNLDIVFCALNGKVIGLDGYSGDELWVVDLAAHIGDDNFDLNHAPLIADFDGDGTIDVFVVGGYTNYPEIEFNYGRAYMISIGLGTGPDWLMFQHDPRRQSSMCPFEYTSAEIEDHQNLEVGGTIVYPNPANQFVTFKLDVHSGNAIIRVFNASGQLISNTNDSSNLQITVNIEGWDNGLYFYQIQFENGLTEEGKFVVE